MGFSQFVYINLTSAICCFIFLIFLFITYFTKKNMNNIENKIYRHILINNALCLLTYIISYSLFIYYGSFPDYHQYDNLTFSVAKMAPVFIDIWALLIVYYILFITSEKNEKLHNFLIKEKNKILLGIYIIATIAAIITLLFENIVFNYRTGTEVNHGFITIMWVLYIAFFLMVFLVFTRGKYVSKKKALPLYMIIVISIISCLSGAINVPIIVLFPMITLINHLMYHTIENPDMKMVTELTLAKDQAEKANNAKSDFLSSMSHELRTPLNAIVGLSQMIQTTTQEEETKNDIEDIIKSSKNLLELVDGILDINKLETNEMKLNEANYNPREVFEDLGKMIKIRIGDKPIEYRARISDTLPTTLYGDKDKVKSIILNLLTNAVKYTDQGSIDFVVDSMIVKGKCNLRISVSDTGRGIAEDQMQYMFTKFYRREEDKDSDIEGTGLGLAITKSLVDLMEGKITINSTEGMGSTFLVTLAQEIVEEKQEKEEIVETL